MHTRVRCERTNLRASCVIIEFLQNGHKVEFLSNAHRITIVNIVQTKKYHKIVTRLHSHFVIKSTKKWVRQNSRYNTTRIRCMRMRMRGQAIIRVEELLNDGQKRVSFRVKVTHAVSA